MKKVTLVAVNAVFLLIFLESSAFSCSVCFYGSPNNLATIAMQLGVVFLLGILLGVLFTFAKFFLNIRKRTQLMTKGS